MVRYPVLVLSFTQAHLRNTPFCKIFRDSCAIPPPPPQKQAQKTFAIPSPQVSRDMKRGRYFFLTARSLLLTVGLCCLL